MPTACGHHQLQHRKSRLAQLLSMGAATNSQPEERGRSRGRGRSRNVAEAVRQRAKSVMRVPSFSQQQQCPLCQQQQQQVASPKATNGEDENKVSSSSQPRGRMSVAARRRARSEVRHRDSNNVLALAAASYEEPADFGRLARVDNYHKKVGRSKSKSRIVFQQAANTGVLTIWPGKAGVWLPQ